MRRSTPKKFGISNFRTIKRNIFRKCKTSNTTSFFGFFYYKSRLHFSLVSKQFDAYLDLHLQNNTLALILAFLLNEFYYKKVNAIIIKRKILKSIIQNRFFRLVVVTRIWMPKLIASFNNFQIEAILRINGHDQIDSSSDPDQEYINTIKKNTSYFSIEYTVKLYK